MARFPAGNALLLLLMYVLIHGRSCEGKEEGEELAGMFVFGGSMMDSGNNNYMKMTAKANYEPYGLDFAEGPTGRFSNGKTLVDALGELLQLPKYLPVFEDPDAKGQKIVHGVNYAAGGSGILEETGSLNGMHVVSLKQQVSNFESVTLPNLKQTLGEKLPSLLAHYVFLVGSGGDDYLLNYFSKHQEISLREFTDTLITTLTQQLKKLYGLGARKFVVLAIPPLGCLPVVRSSPGGAGSCVEEINRIVEFFNFQLKYLVDDLKPQLQDANLVFVNLYKITKDIIDNPTSQGFKETQEPCCELPSDGQGGHGILCLRKGGACMDRDSHVFWDGFHLSQAVNQFIAKKAYDSSLQSEVYPFNLKQLVRL